jgi:hypothetical protein
MFKPGVEGREKAVDCLSNTRRGGCGKKPAFFADNRIDKASAGCG